MRQGADKKFIVDTMLGKLGRWMLLLGYDVVYFRGTDDAELIQMAQEQGRTIITRDTHLALDRYPRDSFLIKSTHIWDQLRRIVGEFPLDFSKTFLSRCSHCNIPLDRVERDEVLPELPPRVKDMASVFFRCPKCQKLYWDGTHPIHILELLERHIGLQIERN